MFSKSLFKLIILCIPIVVWSILVYLVDPFNYFNSSTFISDDVKLKNADKLNKMLYRGIDFHNNPHSKILVGDSRTNHIPVDSMEFDYKLFTASSAKLQEMVDMIYFASNRTDLDTVVLGINFSLFNEYAYSDRFKNVEDIVENPLKYIYNKNVAEAGFYVLRAHVSGENLETSPPMTKDKFWKWNVNVKTKHWYKRYKYPNGFESILSELVRYSKTKGFQLIIINLPLNNQFSSQMDKYGVRSYEIQYKNFLSNLDIPVYDFDYENSITTDQSNYSDPIHFKRRIGKIIIREVLNNNLKIGRLL